MTGDSVSADEVRGQLARICGSGDFDASDRNRRFLEYIVEEALAGRADRIKAYAVATSVFGRDAAFDAQMDPIVRIEARRLRRALERYYLLGGSNDPVRVSIPKGSYIPTFEAAPNDPADGHESPRTTAACSRTGASIFVMAFDADERGSGLAAARGLTRDIVVALTRFAELSVYGPIAAGGAPVEDAEPSQDVDFVLEGAVAISDARLRIHILLSDRRSGRHIWADVHEGPFDEAKISSVADSVARTLAQPYGIFFAVGSRDRARTPLALLTPQDCVIGFYDYWRHFDRQEHAVVRADLERTVRETPNHAEALACLSLIYADVFRFRFDAGTERDPLWRALKLGRRAVELAPHASRGHHALGLALWFAGDVAASLRSLEAGRACNVNDTPLLAEMGFRLALLGDFDRSAPMIEQAYASNPALPGVFRVALSLQHFARGRFAAALAEAKQAEAPDVPYVWIVTAIAAARLGRAKEAAAAVAGLLGVAPDYAEQVDGDLALRNLKPELAREVADALRQAGLPRPRNGPAATTAVAGGPPGARLASVPNTLR